MKKLACLLMTLILPLTLFGCSLTGSTPAATTQTTATQLHAAVSAVNAYCSVIPASDLEVSKVCATVQDAVSVTQPVVDLALSTLLAIFTKRAVRARVLLDGACEH